MTASLKLTIFNLCYAACSLAIGVAGGEITSHEEHQLRRIAMQDAFQQHHQSQPHSSSSSDDVDDDVNKSSVFFSTVQEQRSYYYFHAGVEMAWKHVQRMSSPAPGDEEEDEVTDKDNTDLQQLEDALEVELVRVRQQLALLQKADDADTDVVIAGETEEATKSGSEEEVPPEQRIQQIFKEQYLQFECTDKSRVMVSYEDAQMKWSEIRRRYLNFVNIMSEEMDDNNPFIANPQLYVNFATITDNDTSISTDNNNSESINSTNTTTTTNNTQSTSTTKRLGLFASQDFAQGDIVYTQKTPNRVYFSSPTQWIKFLHSLSSSNTSRGNDDACLALEWSFMKQISRPGRWMLGLVLDESVFMARVEEAEEGDEYYYEEDESEQQGDEEGDDDTKNLISNVALDDERSFEYVALRDIKMGEEIVERALPVEGKREWYL